jgi:predicted  nucleic acid-binding Zn-ribbon protein
MDKAQFEALEAHVVSLVEAFARVKAENKRLSQNVKQLQEALRTQQREVERLQPDREELTQLRTVVQVFQKERDVIRQKLEHMLATIEWLEGHTHVDSETKA